MDGINNTMNLDEKYGYIYLAKLLIPNKPVYKIGHCSLYKQRLAEYTKLPYEVEYIGLWMIDKDELVSTESKLHHRYKKKRLNGEWFDLSIKDIEEIKNFFNDNNIINECLTLRHQCIIRISKWAEEKEPDGYEPLFVVYYKDNIFLEQDCGNVPYLLEKCDRGAEKGTLIKRYPTLRATEINLRNQNHRYSKFDKKKTIKCWGSNRKECYEKMKRWYKHEIESEEQILKTIQIIRDNNQWCNDVIEMINSAENKEIN